MKKIIKLLQIVGVISFILYFIVGVLYNYLVGLTIYLDN